jgi:hypothetical protein
VEVARYVEELQRQLHAAATPETQEVVTRLAGALEAAARLAVLEALSDAAGEITRELAPGSVDVRLRGRDVDFVVTMPATDTTDATTAAPPEEPDDGTTSRTTLRLPESLKARAEAAAGAAGVSLNTWFVRAVSAQLEPRRRAPESHGGSYTGWVR